MQPVAYLTCELKGRDLASRLLIASHLLERGYFVIVGQQWSIFSNLRVCPKGAVLFKTTNATQAEWMGEARANGHVAIASDEECLAAIPEEYANSTHESAMRNCHAFLAANAAHAREIKKAFPAAADKVSVAGSARVDVMRAATPLRPMTEPYILINTSFCLINHLSKDMNEAARIWIGSGGYEVNDKTKAMVKERLAFERSALTETLGVIDRLLGATARKIVLRPHPTESADTWTSRYANNGRIAVVPGSDPVPWMKHAMLLIHNESTTGIEAAIMGVNAINLSPPAAWSERLLVSSVNFTARTADEAAGEAVRLFAGGEPAAPKIDPKVLFPDKGAETTAEEIARHLPDPQPATGRFTWHQIQRTDFQREKFTVALDEVRPQVRGAVDQIDDSVFLLQPK